MADKIMPSSMHDGILDLLKDLALPRVILIGGEPTIYPNLEALITKITQREIVCGMVTNGRKLKNRDFVRKLRDSGLASATFSLEGSTDLLHDETTGARGSFSDLVVGIGNALNEGLSVATNTVISRLNCHDLENVVDLVRSLGISTATFNVCGLTISHAIENPDLMVSPREAALAFERVHSYAKSKGIKTRLVTPLPRCGFDDLDTLKTDKAVPGGPCQLVTGANFVIDYDGSVLPCTHFGGHPLFNVLHQDKSVIGKEEFFSRYDSSFARQFRDMVSRHPSQQCEGCKENCTGGCPIYWLKLDPEKHIRGHRNRQNKEWSPTLLSSPTESLACREAQLAGKG